MKEIYTTLTNETTTIQLDYQKLERALTFFNTRIEVYEKTKELQERALSTLKEKEEAHDAFKRVYVSISCQYCPVTSRNNNSERKNFKVRIRH